MGSISPLALLIMGVLSFVVASSAGAKRRIGFGWSLFLCLGGFIPGLIATYLSPLNKELTPPPDKAPQDIYNKVLGCIGVLFGFFKIYKALNPTAYESLLPDEPAQEYKVALGVYFIGIGIFLLNRTSRHKRAYKDAKSIIIKNEE